MQRVFSNMRPKLCNGFEDAGDWLSESTVGFESLGIPVHLAACRVLIVNAVEAGQLRDEHSRLGAVRVVFRLEKAFRLKKKSTLHKRLFISTATTKMSRRLLYREAKPNSWAFH